MIGNAMSWGEHGYTVLEAGDLDRRTLSLRVTHYLVCDPAGQVLDAHYPTLEAARLAVEQLEAGPD